MSGFQRLPVILTESSLPINFDKLSKIIPILCAILALSWVINMFNVESNGYLFEH